MTFAEASSRLGISTEALRRRADRGRWSRTKGNDGKTRVLVPEAPVRTMSEARANGRHNPAEGVQTMSEHKHADAPALVSALEGHIATLKADIARLTAELASEKERATADLASERAAQQADQARSDKLIAELAAEKERAGVALAAAMAEMADIRDADLAAQLAQQALRDEQLAAARAAADRGTADLVALAQRLTTIAEERTQTSSHEEVLEPPRRGRLGRAWEWFLRH